MHNSDTVGNRSLCYKEEARKEPVPSTVPMLSCVKVAASFVRHEETVTPEQEGPD